MDSGGSSAGEGGGGGMFRNAGKASPGEGATRKPRTPAELAGMFAMQGVDQASVRSRGEEERHTSPYEKLLSPQATKVLEEARSWRSEHFTSAIAPHGDAPESPRGGARGGDEDAEEEEEGVDDGYDDDDFESASVASSHVASVKHRVPHTDPSPHQPEGAYKDVETPRSRGGGDDRKNADEDEDEEEESIADGAEDMDLLLAGLTEASPPKGPRQPRGRGARPRLPRSGDQSSMPTSAEAGLAHRKAPPPPEDHHRALGIGLL
ncbi:hypothetical protein T484DRAFT_2545856 [Baffinella frigidus]|nr:hypothetical protein T484DRAFT_2545856 [Cryptophyta sp. CCMP2293]